MGQSKVSDSCVFSAMTSQNVCYKKAYIYPPTSCILVKLFVMVQSLPCCLCNNEGSARWKQGFAAKMRMFGLIQMSTQGCLCGVGRKYGHI